MRRFRFVGDPKDYSNDFVNGIIYDSDYVPAGKNRNAEWCATEYPSEWQEVFDNDGGTILTTCNPLHKDTDLGMFSAMFVGDLLKSSKTPDYHERIVSDSILLAKELIKQLNEETK